MLTFQLNAQTDSSTKPRKINAYFSPNKENEKIVSSFIRGAKTKLEVLAYSITNEEIGRAIRDVIQRKVSVRLLCDYQQASVRSSLCTSLAGRLDKESGLMHNKVIIRDNDCVLTGSFNFTNNAVLRNRENFVIICDESVVSQYQNDFDIVWRKNT